MTDDSAETESVSDIHWRSHQLDLEEQAEERSERNSDSYDAGSPMEAHNQQPTLLPMVPRYMSLNGTLYVKCDSLPELQGRSVNEAEISDVLSISLPTGMLSGDPCDENADLEAGTWTCNAEVDFVRGAQVYATGLNQQSRLSAEGDLVLQIDNIEGGFDEAAEDTDSSRTDAVLRALTGYVEQAFQESSTLLTQLEVHLTEMTSNLTETNRVLTRLEEKTRNMVTLDEVSVALANLTEQLTVAMEQEISRLMTRILSGVPQIPDLHLHEKISRVISGAIDFPVQDAFDGESQGRS